VEPTQVEPAEPRVARRMAGVYPARVGAVQVLAGARGEGAGVSHPRNVISPPHEAAAGSGRARPSDYPAAV
jgi:hypothetical protein